MFNRFLTAPACLVMVLCCASFQGQEIGNRSEISWQTTRPTALEGAERPGTAAGRSTV